MRTRPDDPGTSPPVFTGPAAARTWTSREGPTRAARPDGPAGGIVVGVDGSPSSLAALRWAVREGTVRGRTVQAVTAWHFPVPSSVGNVATVDERHPVIAAEEVLAAALVAAGVADDDTTVTTAAVEGHPAEVLMQLAEQAELLVVGSRGHGRIFGALLGSISQYVASRAACPVVVITPATSTGRKSPVRR